METTHASRTLIEFPALRELGIDRLHFIGAGGVGMSAVAQGAARAGLHVTGSDLHSSLYTRLLEALGVTVRVGTSPDLVEDAQAVVVSSAIPGADPDLQLAREIGLPILHRSEILAALLAGRQSICVTGSHGKTTVTAMIARALEASGFDPLAFVGGYVPDFRGNVRFGEGPYAVAEADESDGSFLRLPADFVAVTNIESEHLEYWGDEQQLLHGFRRFLKSIRNSGFAVVNLDDPGVRNVLCGLGIPVLTSSVQAELANFSARDIEFRPFGSAFEFLYEGLPLGRVELSVPGLHNVSNAVLALGMVLGLGGDFDRMAEALSTFSGIGRRFEILGEAGGVLVVNDYAHHPTEVAATLVAARRAADARGGRLFVLFQPHRYTRTRCCLERYGACFCECDGVAVTEIYGAGETPIEGVSGALVAEAIAHSIEGDVTFTPRLDRAAAHFLPRLAPGDLVIAIGAGDIVQAGEAVLSSLAARSGSRAPIPVVPLPSPLSPEVSPC